MKMTERLEIDVYFYGHLIFNKGTNIIQCQLKICMGVKPKLLVCIKINTKQITDLNLRAKTIELREHISENLCDTGVGISS